MLNREQAAAQLEKLRNNNWIKERLSSAERLSAGLYPHARVVLRENDNTTGYLDWAKHQKAMLDAGRDLEALSVNKRTGFFAALFTEIAPIVEATWQRLKTGPYQTGLLRKPFRAPDAPQLTLGHRVNWLISLAQIIGPYPHRLPWLAAWAPFIDNFGDTLGQLFATAINCGGGVGAEVYDILTASGRGEHDIGGMGRHVIRGLLSSSKSEGWEFIEKMLLAAQREEGLRQSILETVDEAHPDAFKRMLRLIIENNLARFSATVRAADVWLGYQWDAAGAPIVNQVLEHALTYLDDAKARQAAIAGSDAEQVFLGLWSEACANAIAAVQTAVPLLRHEKVEHRYAAAHFLSLLGITTARDALLSVLEDVDLRVVSCALEYLQPHVFLESETHQVGKSGLFERLEKLVSRCPRKPGTAEPLVWPWASPQVTQETAIGCLIANIGSLPATRLLPYLPRMSAAQRSILLRQLNEIKKWDASIRDTVFGMLGDASRSVREAALKALAKHEVKLTEAEAIRMEELLTRSAGDLRRGVLTLLLQRDDARACASAERLTGSPSAPQRQAGLELLRLMKENRRNAAECRQLCARYKAAHPDLDDADRQQIQAIEQIEPGSVTIENGLGLIDHNHRTWPEQPVIREVQLHSPAAVNLIGSLDDLIHENRETPVVFKRWGFEEVNELLGNLRWGFGHPKDSDFDRSQLPLLSLWESWWEKRDGDQRDADTFELLRAYVWFSAVVEGERGLDLFRRRIGNAPLARLYGSFPKKKFRYVMTIQSLLSWLLRLYPPSGETDFLLDAVETSIALVPSAELRRLPAEGNWIDREWRSHESPFMQWRQLAGQFHSDNWKPEQHVRFWRLLRWIDEPLGRETKKEQVKTESDSPRSRQGRLGKMIQALKRIHIQGIGDFAGLNDMLARSKTGHPDRHRPAITELLPAFKIGGATDSDIYDLFLGERPRPSHGFWRSGRDFSVLRETTSRKRPVVFEKYPESEFFVNRSRERILEIELKRGDSPTPATEPALALRCVWGVDTLVSILRALGERPFVRGWSHDNESKETVLSHLARCGFPLQMETAEVFKQKVNAAGIDEKRLVELAVYAPQWASFVETALEWKGLAEGVWWIHGHTKGDDWTVDREIRELWKADLAQHTSLRPEDLLDGAVDTVWFGRVIAGLGEARWEKLYDAAKFASSGTGHARARIFADAMMGKLSKKDVLSRIEKKRHQDTVRALGLLPLAEKSKREADVLERFQVLQGFVRGSRQFGSQRQASEKRAAIIGQENLARTAGYPDPIRLQWAMEARAVADLADGPISVTVDKVTVALGIDPWGEVLLTVSKDGKVLADIPTALKKHADVALLRKRKTELKRQASRIRPSLEQLMVRGEMFSAKELQDLMRHPLLAPMLRNLVLTSEGLMGYPAHDGKVLEDCAGHTEPLRPSDKLRIAHALDFLPAEKWHEWQKDCFGRERVQPFKQVFRETYVLTAAETQEGLRSRRYAGHQVQPRRALALLGTRGWIHHPEEGVRKTFHEVGLTAWIEFQESFYTPAEIEGLTLEAVYFTKRGQWEPLKLDGIPARLFSETMRDLDLVASVAHRGGVDPEASASTLEMRAGLVNNTCSLLKLSNVRIKDNWVLVDGSLGHYSIHLGSATTRRMPGETLFIVPVHSQHRGRLFLPFADDDPKSAEVVSKVILLARDSEIKDPNLLHQIRG
jgi:hypothetical protein